MKKLKLFSLLMLLFVGVTQMWGTSYISYNGSAEDTNTTISSKNVSSGSAGKISWTGTSCTYSDSRVNIAANGSIAFTADNGYAITKIVITSGSSTSYYGTWTSSPSVTPSKSSGTTTFDGLSANSVTVTTSTAFRCTSASSIKIYYAQVVTNLSVGTAPTKVNYKVGETLDLTGLVLNADGNNVSSGYTASPANGATLNSVGAQNVTLTYGGKSTTQAIHVGELTGIAITTEPTKTEYNQGQTFDPTGMVVTATFSDKEETPTSWTEDVTGYSYSPDDALETTDTEIEVSYTYGTETKTATQDITVNAATAYTVTFNAGTGSCATSSLTEETGLAGVTLPTATISVTGWSFAGWAAASTTNTEVAPTLYAASSTYHPTENCTLYAVYKFADASAYKRATDVSDITSASSVVIVCNNQSKVLDNTLASGVNAPTESGSKITASESAIFTLTGNNSDGYTLTNGTINVGATSTDNSTVISNATTNNKWVVKAHNTSNTFYFENKGKSNLCLEYYSNSGYKWMVYAPTTPSTNAAMAMKVYVPVIVYNSNPAAIINPTIAFTTAGNKSLYVQDEATYDNAANVTGIDKTPVYSSSDATVATVSAAGVVTALKAGTTTITAKIEKEVGVNTEASTSYTVTVKDAKTIAGLKTIDNTSGKSFVADLTDAVVTYVKDNYAYIQDASAAIMVNFANHGLTAGKKINGAVSGTVKISYSIDQLTALTLTDATVTDDGVIPTAAVVTLATIKNAGTEYDGKLVSVSGATVTGSIATDATSGASIKDGSKIAEEDVSMNLFAPNKGVEIKAAEEGTFSGFISLYNGSTYRLNIYDQSQITLTKNAPTDQPLEFESDAVVLNNPSDEYSAFTGQTISGNKGTPAYSIDSDDDDVVTSINSETGAVVLSGKAGTATIKVTAAAKEETEGGVTTPWKETTKTYTITVKYTVNLVIKVDGVAEAHGNTATIAGGTDPVYKNAGETVALTATPTTGYQFVNWTASTEDITFDGAIATIDTAGTIYANFTAVPEIVVSETSLDLGTFDLNDEVTNEKKKTFTIRGASLNKEENITFTLADGIKDAFTISPSPVSVPEGGTLSTTTITVTPVTTTVGTFSGALTIAGGGLAEAKTVTLSSVVRQTYTVTWVVNGDDETYKQTAIEGATLTGAPDLASSTLAGKVFRGWTDAAINGKTDVKPTIVTLTEMPAKDTTLYALYATENSEDLVKEFSYTINSSTFTSTSYGDGSKTNLTAYCTSDNTLSVKVGFTYAKMCYQSTNIQGKASAGKMYNTAPWGRGVTSVTINNAGAGDNFAYGIGSSSQPTSVGTGAYFNVYAGDSYCTASSVVIVFDSLVNVTTYNEYITNAYVVTYDANGGSCATASATYVGTPLVLPEATHATLYFVGWYDEEEGGNKIGYAGNEYTPTADITLYAHWSETEPTGFDNTEVDAKAVKVMRNGILYIEKNGKTFNAQGLLIK